MPGEPGTAGRHFDACPGAEVDLSAICWIATANPPDGVAGPLASRFEMVAKEAPGLERFDLALAGVVTALERSRAVPAGMLPGMPARARAAGPPRRDGRPRAPRRCRPAAALI